MRREELAEVFHVPDGVPSTDVDETGAKETT